MITLTALVTLFTAAFLAATIIPFQSEAVFVALQLGNVSGLVVLVAIASLGNTLGAFVNYAIGMRVEAYRDRRWFPMRPDQLERTQGWWRMVAAAQLGACAGMVHAGCRHYAHAFVAIRAACDHCQDRTLCDPGVADLTCDGAGGIRLSPCRCKDRPHRRSQPHLPRPPPALQAR